MALCALFFSGATWAGPTAAKEPVERLIMAGDRLRITVAEQNDLSRVYAVAGDGTIDFGFIGRITVSDLSVTDAARMIEKLLEESYFKDATVTVNVEEFVEGAIMVMGAVKSPGTLPFRSDEILTLMEVIMRSGGLASSAAGNQVRILRWQPGGRMDRQIITVDVQSMIEDMDFSKDQYMRPRDIVIVPSIGEGSGERREFLALGEVGSPGFHPYTEGMDVIRAVTRIGGLSSDARWEAVRLLRPDDKGGYSVIPLNLSTLFGAADMSMNVPLRAGDILFVPSMRQASRGEVYLLGQVKNPGAVPLPLDSRATLAKTLLAAGGVEKFGNDSKVRILRTAPDGSKQTLEVNVARILATGAFDEDVPLENGDVIIVPERMWF